MLPARAIPVLFISAFLCGTLSTTDAQVYKWVDEKGVVNYGDKPPARGKSAQQLAENGGGSVSVVPGISKDEMDNIRQRDMQRRVRQLENEVDALRARDMARDSAVPYSAPADTYVPDYVYGYGYGYPPRRRPPVTGHPGARPEQPIVRPDHPIATPHNRSTTHAPVKGGPLEPSIPNVPTARGAAGRG